MSFIYKKLSKLPLLLGLRIHMLKKYLDTLLLYLMDADAECWGKLDLSFFDESD